MTLEFQKPHHRRLIGATAVAAALAAAGLAATGAAWRGQYARCCSP